MDTIVKVLNEKVADGDAKTIVEALKQIDPNAEGETVAEVLKNMNIGGGGSSSGVPVCTVTYVYQGSNENPQIEFNSVDMLDPFSYALNPESPYGIDTRPFTLSISENTSVKYLYNYLTDQELDVDGWICMATTGIYDFVRLENLVNIGEDSVIIDPSKDSSFTIVLADK